MAEHYVYRYSDPSRNEVIYVGMGKKRRAWSHLKRKDNHHFTHRLNKMQAEGVKPTIDFICEGVDAEFAGLVEMEAIAKYGRRHLETGSLLNVTAGGDGFRDPTPEASSKLSNSLKNSAAHKEAMAVRKASPEYEDYRKHMRQINLGRKLPSHEAWNKGLKLSPEYVQKLREVERPGWTAERHAKAKLRVHGKQPLMTCLFCKKTGGAFTMPRWHRQCGEAK
jgi:hypothetical protein